MKKPLPKLFTNEQQEILTGLMLGDGHLSKIYPGQPNSYLEVLRSSKDRKYLLWNAEKFSEFLTAFPINDRKIFLKQTQKTYQVSRLRTRSSVLFTELRKLWYPNDTKIVPYNLELTPLTVAIWFADDGHLLKDGTFNIHTEGFTELEVHILSKKLSQLLHSNITIWNRNNRQKYIYGNIDASLELFRIITQFLPPGMERKTRSTS